MCFFDIFDHLFIIDELFHALMGIKTNKEALIHFLAQEKHIEQKEDFYFLRGHQNLVEMRKNHQAVLQKLQKKVHHYLPFIQLIPYVRMVAVCNTLAMGTANSQSDIDLLIVTAPNRIFLARTLTTFLFSLLGIRRHGTKIAGRFCLSFYMNEEHTDLKNIMQNPDDIYLLYWFRTLKPVYGKEMYKKFIQSNNWINEKYFIHEQNQKIESFQKTKKIFRVKTLLWEYILNHTIANVLEKKLAQIHTARHQKNIQKFGPESSVIVNETMLKFHNIDRRQEFLEKFKKNYAEFCV